MKDNTKKYKNWLIDSMAFELADGSGWVAHTSVGEVVNGGGAVEYTQLDFRPVFSTQQEAIDAGFVMSVRWIDDRVK